MTILPLTVVLEKHFEATVLAEKYRCYPEIHLLFIRINVVDYYRCCLQAHQDVFRQLVDLIGITSIMEVIKNKIFRIKFKVFQMLVCSSIWCVFMVQVLVRLVGADDHVYPNFIDVMQWLAESNLLEMIVDKLSPSVSWKIILLFISIIFSFSHSTYLWNIFV